MLRPLIIVLAAASVVCAQAHADDSRPAWAGSAVGVSNTVSALTLDPGAEPNYNPYYAVGISVAPRWAFAPWVSLSGSIAATHEVTEADGTTMSDETLLSDTGLSLGLSGAKIPGIGVGLSGGIKATFPTSLASRAQTLQVGVTPSLRLSKRFAILEGLTLGYGGSVRINAHAYTTSARKAPRIASCRGADCAEFLNTGVRNSQYQTANTVSLGLGLTKWLGLSSSFGVYTSHLYEGQTVDEVSLIATEPTDTRYAVSYGLSARIGPFAGLTTSIGASTFNPQLAPNSTYYRPVFNRYTQLSIDLSFDISSVVASKDKG